MEDKKNPIAGAWDGIREPRYSDAETRDAYVHYAKSQCQKRLDEDEEALDKLIDVPGKEAQAARMEARVLSWEVLLAQVGSMEMFVDLHEQFHEAFNDIAHVLHKHAEDGEERDAAIKALGYIAPVFGLQQVEVRIEFIGGDDQ